MPKSFPSRRDSRRYTIRYRRPASNVMAQREIRSGSGIGTVAYFRHLRMNSPTIPGSGSRGGANGNPHQYLQVAIYENAVVQAWKIITLVKRLGLYSAGDRHDSAIGGECLATTTHLGT
jgi:hypothetical protein